MARTVLRVSLVALATAAGLLVVVITLAGVTDRPSAEPVVVDRDAPEVVAFLDAERALMDHHGLGYAEHDVALDDPALRVRVLEVGDGPPVVAVPPAVGEAARFASLLAELDGFRFLLLNLPGGGASDGIDLRAVDHRRLARATLDAVFDHFGLDTAPIVASSVGGTWALWYGLDRPDRVTAAVQLGVPAAVKGTSVPPALGALGVPGVNRLLAATVLPATSPDAAGDVFAEVFGHPPETVEALPGPALTYEHAAQQLAPSGCRGAASGATASASPASAAGGRASRSPGRSSPASASRSSSCGRTTTRSVTRAPHGRSSRTSQTPRCARPGPGTCPGSTSPHASPSSSPASSTTREHSTGHALVAVAAVLARFTPR